jgi:hypothetical protein
MKKTNLMILSFLFILLLSLFINELSSCAGNDCVSVFDWLFFHGLFSILILKFIIKSRNVDLTQRTIPIPITKLHKAIAVFFVLFIPFEFYHNLSLSYFLQSHQNGWLAYLTLGIFIIASIAWWLASILLISSQHLPSKQLFCFSTVAFIYLTIKISVSPIIFAFSFLGLLSFYFPGAISLFVGSAIFPSCLAIVTSWGLTWYWRRQLLKKSVVSR